ncbi:MAG: MBL fold metallo-hydrolase [Candidatus Micrarchaeaceae archaeon]
MVEMDFVRWLGHASFLFEYDKKNIYVDPYKLKKPFKKADMIFITHPHFDHLSPDDIKLISKTTTKIFAPLDSVSKIPHKNVIGVEPNKGYEDSGIKIETIPAYNTVNERLNMHPKENKWVGYVVDLGGKRVYHAGDTDEIPEMNGLRVDLALLPMGGTYTMTTDEMIKAAKKIKAKSIAPIHYKMLLGKDGSKEAEERFLKQIKNGVIIDEENPEFHF